MDKGQKITHNSTRKDAINAFPLAPFGDQELFGY